MRDTTGWPRMVMALCMVWTCVYGRAPARAAEFDIDAGRVVLRQLQFCTDCGSALLVTGIHPGTMVRCPDCGKEQTRIAHQHVLSQMYQLCNLCGGPLDHEGHHAGDMVECHTCHTRQVLSRDVFALARRDNGPGYAPGAPPGTGKKTLLLSPNREDARLAMIPLDDSDHEALPLPPDIPDRPGDTGRPIATASRDTLPGETVRDTPVEKADADADDLAYYSETVVREEVRKKLPPPEWAEEDAATRSMDRLRMPDAPREAAGRDETVDVAVAPAERPARPDRSRVGVQAPVRDAPAALGETGTRGGRAGPRPEPPIVPARRESGAVPVPAVTADLFGGRRAGGSDERYISTGPVVARVDGEPIYARDIDRVVEPVAERLRAQGNVDAAVLEPRLMELRREVLERLIDREVAMREAAAIGFRPDPAAVREREKELSQILAGTGVDIRSEARRDVIMQEMRRRYAEKPVAANPEAVREFYRQHKDQLVQPRKVAIDQLVVFEDRTGRSDRRSAREIAMDIAAALESGQRFDGLRQRHDEFWPAAGLEYVPPTLQFEAVYARQVLLSAGDLRKGAVFGPVFMNGMVLFGKITDDRPEGPVPFEEVEREIRNRLESEAVEKNLDAWLKRLRQKTQIEIFM